MSPGERHETPLAQTSNDLTFVIEYPLLQGSPHVTGQTQQGAQVGKGS